MKQKTSYTFLIILLLLLSSAASVISCNGEPDVKIYTFPSQQGNPVPAPASGQQNIPSSGSKEQSFERNVVVTAQNNYFPIGVWAGIIETTELSAEKPIDISFGDMPENLQLEINGSIVQRSYRWETKIGTRTGITSLSYKVTNATAQDYSYTLYMTPSPGNSQIKVTVKQKFTSK
jgi:hypothetical protein